MENLLRSHAAVADVAVIGVPHDKMGEVPRAYVVKADPSVTEDELHVFVNESVAEYKRLVGGIEFLEAIPKSAAGKILRKDLVAAYMAKAKSA